MSDDHIDRIHTRVKEIRALYDVTEAEYHLVLQMAAVLKVTMGVSPKLLLKITKVFSAITEAALEENPELAKESDD